VNYEKTKYFRTIDRIILPTENCEIAVLWEANQISPFSRLTQSLIFNEWPSENGFGDENGPKWDAKITN
jgi:hypothetical protein